MEKDNQNLALLIQKLDSKVDLLVQKLDSKIDRISSDLNLKIDRISSDLNSKIDRISSDFDLKLSALQTKLLISLSSVIIFTVGIAFIAFAYINDYRLDFTNERNLSRFEKLDAVVLSLQQNYVKGKQDLKSEKITESEKHTSPVLYQKKNLKRKK